MCEIDFMSYLLSHRDVPRANAFGNAASDWGVSVLIIDFLPNVVVPSDALSEEGVVSSSRSSPLERLVQEAALQCVLTAPLAWRIHVPVVLFPLSLELFMPRPAMLGRRCLVITPKEAPIAG